jgi:hypothetical protein
MGSPGQQAEITIVAGTSQFTEILALLGGRAIGLHWNVLCNAWLRRAQYQNAIRGAMPDHETHYKRDSDSRRSCLITERCPKSESAGLQVTYGQIGG